VGGGLLKIFSARRSQNNIAGVTNINGTTFVPGSYGVDSATEVWSTYYTSSLGNLPFTIFYKEPLLISELLPSILTSLFIPNFEMLFRLQDSRFPSFRRWFFYTIKRECNIEKERCIDEYIRYFSPQGEKYQVYFPFSSEPKTVSDYHDL
jgi:hypothetical protein